ncbi:hypothetical protein D3C81_519870 [compost metagenome]
MKQELNIKITAKTVDNFMKAESRLKAIDCVEMINQFESVEYSFDTLQFRANELININKINLPKTCRIKEISINGVEKQEGEKKTMEYHVKMYVKVTPVDEQDDFVCAMNFKSRMANIEITNR